MSATTRAIRVTVLVENTPGGPGLPGEHGLAFWVEAGPKRVLFDTGQGKALSGNAHKLGVSLERTDAVVLSHGHHDHTGGLAQVLQAAPQAKVFAHPRAFQKKYGRNDDGTGRDIGIRRPDEDKARGRAEDLIWTNQPTEICHGLFVTGEIPRATDLEDTGGKFFVDEQCLRPDPLIDDQAMFFDSAAGTVVLLGCAHAGVINTLRYVRELTGGKPVYAVMGGMHLVNATPERIDRTAEALRQLNVARLGLAHCTGIGAAARLCSAFPGRCFACSAGTVVEYQAVRAGQTVRPEQG